MLKELNVQRCNLGQGKERYIKALVYGQAGAGKTRFCADSPDPLWFDFESSTETLYHIPEYHSIPVKKPKDIEELKRDVKAAVLDPGIATVVIDSITTSLDYYLRRRMESVAAKTGQVFIIRGRLQVCYTGLY